MRERQFWQYLFGILGYGSGPGPGHVAMFHAHAFFKAADAQNAGDVNPSLDSYAL